MAAYPWIVPYENQGMKLEDFPNLKRWFEHIRGREATRRAYAIADTVQGRTDLRTDEEARRHLFAR
jgi:GST-like protein